MSLQDIETAYRNLRANDPSGKENILRFDLYPFIKALGEFGRSLVPVGLYATLAHDAEEFSNWIFHEVRIDDDDDCYTDMTAVRESVAFNDETFSITIITPLLKKGEIYDLAPGGFPFSELDDLKKVLERRNPVGYYVLRLASAARDVSEKRDHFVEELADCIELDRSRLLKLTLRAATEFYWEARQQLEEPCDQSTVRGEEQTPLDDESTVRGEEQMPLDDESTVRGEEQTPLDDQESTADEQSSQTAKKTWWHGPHEVPPNEFYTLQSLRGTKKELSMCFYTTGAKPDERRLRKMAANDKVLWVLKHSAQDWQIYFSTEKQYMDHYERLESKKKKA